MTEAARAQEINDLIEESVYGARGAETAPCANAWEVSKLIASLQARVEALEANSKPTPNSPQIERLLNHGLAVVSQLKNLGSVVDLDGEETKQQLSILEKALNDLAELKLAKVLPAASSLVERVAAAIDGAPYDDGLHQWDEARAAIREMAAAARYRGLNGQNVTVIIWEMVAQWLEQEAAR
jgi:hypothetical protein